MKINFGVVLPYLKQVFSDNGSPSASRLLTLLHSLVSCACLVFVTAKTRALPDGMTLTGLGAFVTAPYAINRATVAFGKDQGPKPDVVLPAAVAPRLDLPKF